HGEHRVESNLVRAVANGEPKTWWGDLHGQTRATVGTGTIEEYFAFGRDVALLDMMCHQANDFQVTEAEWQRLRAQIDRFHIGGRYADIVGFHDPALEPLVEIYSDWGRFEWLLEDALRGGYRVGVVANSDGHKGRPGASHPGASQFGAYGGLTCVLADALTREAVFEALKARRCYGVTAAQRIHVELAVNGLPMGAEGRARGPVRITGRVAGTGAVERADVFRGLELIRTVSPYTAR